MFELFLDGFIEGFRIVFSIILIFILIGLSVFPTWLSNVYGCRWLLLYTVVIPFIFGIVSMIF